MTLTSLAGMLNVSMKYHECEGEHVATFRELREDAHYTTFQLAVESGVSMSTINRLESEIEDTPKVTARKASQVLEVLSKKLGQTIRIEGVEGLQERIVQPKSRKRHETTDKD